MFTGSSGGWAPRRPLQAAHRFLRRIARTVLSRDVKGRFTAIYRRNAFGGDESVSGEGSSLEQTAAIRREIPQLVRELGARSFLDAPCGDFHWMRHVELGVERYYGVDIVEDLIADNRAGFGGPGREFLCRDLIRDALPAADIVLCRDCLVHLTFRQAKDLIRNVKSSGSRYLLATTFTGRRENVDLLGRDLWRTLNLELPPFNLPTPMRLIDEHCTQGGGAYADKCLGLWRLDDVALNQPVSPPTRAHVPPSR
jgi:SAM-dependent methyltransferase